MIKNEQINLSLKYYDKNAPILYEKYEKADLRNIQEYILKHINTNDYILELGFGSGREINFLLKNGFKHIYGIDGCEEFVKKAKQRFKSNNFYVSVLPKIDICKNLQFDFIYSIAVWMHLPLCCYEETVQNIVSKLKKNGKVFLSYSLNERNENERYFQKVDFNLIEQLFNKYNLKKTEEFITADSLNRGINWMNQFFEM
jgi:SAM-dependent methyltransferase